jgi:DNA/RNA-binding domain of Phe-tRNA-synthetase-like protein
MRLAENRIEENIKIAVITASGVDLKREHPLLEERLANWLERRRAPLKDREDTFRKACRDMMRTGSYKPTGRGKPASEYLLRTALEGSFPRINTLVDINNYISLKYLVPISLWDTGKADADSWLFRLGKEGESFVFNASGQTLDLKDLVTGFAVKNGKETPIVTPVKDCQQTKTDEHTRSVAAAIYYPARWEDPPALEEIMDEFAGLLEEISVNVITTLQG